MKITFLGTGAADWNWTECPPGTRGSSATLLGTNCLIDAGPTVLRRLAEAGASPARIKDILVTHSHRDHFQPAVIRDIACTARRRLRVWGPPQALARLDASLCDLRPVLPGDSFRAAGCAVTALPANHVTDDFSEQPLHYAFLGRGIRLLYALDGAWCCAKARHFLQRALGGKPLTAVIWDVTCGNTFHDWRFAEHNDLRMVADLRESMIADHLLAPDAIHVFDHIARTLWPATPAEQRRLAARFDGILAQDGLVLDL